MDNREEQEVSKNSVSEQPKEQKQVQPTENQVTDLKSAPSSESTEANSAIPEEYLTDEDLYPETPAEDGASRGIMKKKPLILLIVGGVLGFILILFVLTRIFYNGDGKVTEEKKILRFWGLWQKESVMEELTREFQKQNPNIEIQYTLMDAQDNYRSRVIERTNNNDGPDLYRFHNTWVPMLKKYLAPAPETVFTPDEFKDIYYSVVSEDLVVDEQILGVPYHLDGLVLVYNEDILKKAGVKGPPTTWEELITVAQQITVKDTAGNLETAGIALGTAENISHFSDILGLMFLQNGVNLKDIGNDLNAQTVIDTYTQLALGENRVWGDELENSLTAFANGKVAMIFIPTWRIENLRHLNPDISLKVASVPQIRGGQKTNIANYWVDGVSKGSKHQKEAWEFLKFISQKDNQARLYELDVDSGRLYGNPYARRNMANLLLDNEILAPLIKDAPILSSLPLISYTYDDGLNDESVGYLKDAINSILMNDSPASALRVLSKGLEQVFEKYGY